MPRLALPLLVALLALPAAAQEVSGRLLGPDGAPRPAAQVALQVPWHDAPVAAEADPDGRFSLAARPGFATLRLSAEGLQPLKLPLLLEPGDSLALTVHLADSAGQSRADFEDPASRPARVAEVLRAMWSRSDAVEAARVEAFKANAEAGEAVWQAAMEEASAPFELEKEAERLAAEIEAEADPAVRRALLLEALSLEVPEEVREARLTREALDALGPAGPLWSAKPELIARALDLVAPSDSAAAERFAAEAIERHPDPEVRAYVVLRRLERADRAGDTEAAQEAFEILQEPAYADSAPSFISGVLFDQYDTAGPVRLGAPVPAFHLPLLEGGTVSNAALLGTTYLLDFWATWCVPCIAEMPTLHAAYERFHERGFEIVSLSFDDGPRVVEAFREERYPMPWLNALVEGGFDHPVADAFGLRALPTILLVGADGTVAATDKDLRGERLEATLARVLGDG